MGLCVCSACNRHVKECSAVCPFCGATFVAASVKCAEPSARTAAVAAIGAAVVLGGCASASSASPGYGGACAASGCYAPPPQDASMDSSGDAPAEEAEVRDAGEGGQ